MMDVHPREASASYSVTKQTIRSIIDPVMKKPSTIPMLTEKPRHATAWPKGVPMPKAGASRAGEVWSEAEERLLRRYYQRYGSHYCARLLGRTQNAANVKAA